MNEDKFLTKTKVITVIGVTIAALVATVFLSLSPQPQSKAVAQSNSQKSNTKSHPHHEHNNKITTQTLHTSQQINTSTPTEQFPKLWRKMEPGTYPSIPLPPHQDDQYIPVIINENVFSNIALNSQLSLPLPNGTLVNVQVKKPRIRFGTQGWTGPVTNGEGYIVFTHNPPYTQATIFTTKATYNVNLEDGQGYVYKVPKTDIRLKNDVQSKPRITQLPE